MTTTLPAEEIEALLKAEHSDPFRVLGPHPVEEGGGPATAVRAFLPQAESAEVVAGAQTVPMTRLHEAGLWEAVLPDAPKAAAYSLRARSGTAVEELLDPYAFGPILTDFDLHLLREGTHLRSYEKLGAHLVVHQGAAGVHFAVWAPNALRVSVVGDFNGWDGRRHPMRVLGGSGVWELFIPGLKEGTLYKYEIRSRLGPLPFLKADPYGFAHEAPPRTASVVWDLNKHRWQDGDWMERRRAVNPLNGPVNAYEVHLASWKRGPGSRYLTYAELARELIPYVRDLGFTHIELLPVTEFPFDGSWGYQTVGYYAPTRRFGDPEDFKAFVDACHQAGLGVLLDWVPSHFPTDPHGLAQFDGSALYEHADPRKGFHPDWNTAIFNYGRTEVWNFLVSNALFWLKEYHVDGLRVDAVASMLYLDYSRKAGEWIPNRYGGNENLEAIEFLKHVNSTVHRECPGVLTIAEESTAWPGVSRPVHLGGLGFSLKWNMGWMHDMLEYVQKEPVHRKYHHNSATFSMLYAFHENFQLVLSHDEVVHGKRALLSKMPGDDWEKFANLRVFLGYMAGHPGKKLLFMGAELGQWSEWNHDGELDWRLLGYERHRELRAWVRDVLRLTASEPALHERDFDPSGFEWIDANDSESSVFSFVRYAADRREAVVGVFNFTPVIREAYRVGVPSPGYYRELLNSDAAVYGGTNRGNAGGVSTEDVPWHWRPCSLRLTVPPLGALFLKLQRP